LPWKSWKSIVSAYRRVPAKQPWKWKDVVWKPEIRRERRKQSWFDPMADRKTEEDNRQRADDIAKEQRKRVNKKRQRRGDAVDEEEGEEEGEEEVKAQE
jgi:hypothetical protein